MNAYESMQLLAFLKEKLSIKVTEHCSYDSNDKTITVHLMLEGESISEDSFSIEQP